MARRNHSEQRVGRWWPPREEGSGSGMAAGQGPSPKTDRVRRFRPSIRRSLSVWVRNFAARRTGVGRGRRRGGEVCPLTCPDAGCGTLSGAEWHQIRPPAMWTGGPLSRPNWFFGQARLRSFPFLADHAERVDSASACVAPKDMAAWSARPAIRWAHVRADWPVTPTPVQPVAGLVPGERLSAGDPRPDRRSQEDWPWIC
jgi:hypothetical protein